MKISIVVGARPNGQASMLTLTSRAISEARARLDFRFPVRLIRGKEPRIGQP